MMIGCRNSCENLFRDSLIKEIQYKGKILDFSDSFGMAQVSSLQNIKGALQDNSPYTKLIYVYRGQLDVFLGEEKLFLSEGMILFINAHTQTLLSPHVGEEVTFFVYHFKKEFFDGAFMKRLSDCPMMYKFINYCLMDKVEISARILFNCDTYVVRQTVFTLMELIQKKEYEFIQDVYYSLCNYLESSKHSKFLAEYSTNVNDSVLNDILRYMNGHLSSVTLESLSKEFHYHPSYLSTLIAQEGKTTFKKALQQMRLRAAEEMLIKSERSIMEIARKVGYLDESYFIRLFKRNFGLTPLEYRKKKRDNVL